MGKFPAFRIVIVDGQFGRLIPVFPNPRVKLEFETVLAFVCPAFALNSQSHLDGWEFAGNVAASVGDSANRFGMTDSFN